MLYIVLNIGCIMQSGIYTGERKYDVKNLLA